MKTAYFLFFSLILFSCKGPDSNEYQITCNLNEVKTPSFDELFSGVEIIPLETNAYSAIGTIGKIEVSDYHYFIFDEQIGRVLKFDKKGKYICDIGKPGKGPGEYNDLEDFELNKETGEIGLLSGVPPRIIIYDTLGNYIMSKPLPEDMAFAKSFSSVDNEEVVVFSDVSENYRSSWFNFSNKKKKILKKPLPWFIASKTMFNSRKSPFFKDDKGNIYLSEVFSNEINKLTKNGFEPFITMDFGKNNFNILKHLPKNQDRKYYQDFFEQNKSNYVLYFYFKRIYKNHLYLTFTFDNKFYCFIYNLNDGSNFLFTELGNGGFFPNYPLFSNDYVYCCADKKNLTMLIPEGHLTEHDKENIKSLDDFSNPVLIKYKLAQ